jgi:S-adenosylmethionine-diacylgycerolhomoserine-N-methlytransferase
MSALAHGQLMDRVYRLQRHVYDATRKYYLLGRDDLIAELKPAAGDSVLEIGCGTGRNLVLAAKRYQQARFFGLDISSEMLESARHSVKKNGLGSQITLGKGDAAAFDAKALFGRGGFDRVFMSYTVSMIPPWKAALSSALDLLNPSGSLHIVDFGQQENLPPAFKTALHWWLREFHVTPKPNLKRFLFSEAQSRCFRFEAKSHARDFAWLIKIERPLNG